MKKQHISGAATVLADYLSGFSPVDRLAEGVHLKTTDEIISDLASLVDLEVNEVADTLAAAGSRSHHDGDGRHGWMMKPR